MLLYGNLPVQCYEMECFPFKILGFMNGFIQGKDRDKQRGGMATQRMQNEAVRRTVVFDSLTLAHINIPSLCYSQYCFGVGYYINDLLIKKLFLFV